MPLVPDNSPNILWPLPAGKPAISKANLFSPEVYKEIKETIKRDVNWGPDSNEIYHSIVGRWVAEPDFSERVRGEVLRVAKETWGNDTLRLKALWTARYQQHAGVTPYLWEHMDQSVCQYTLDFCVETNGFDSWGIVIDGEKFEESENSGLFFMGQQQTHSRPPYPVDDPEAYIVLMFGLFIDDTHWGYDLDLNNEEDNAKFRELIEIYRYDGDIRYYEHTGHPPYFNDLPSNNPPCTPNGEPCIQCWVPPQELLDALIEDRSGKRG